ncbi:MAG: BMP family ABC transporter substrate-binding protein [Actinomycetota bacterium]|nr:BMP family ABC transporter substrate-binding protein [Actinomycetota bacterium]
MRFMVLGPIEVVSDGHAISLGGRKQRLVLAHLLRRHGTFVPTDVLVDDVWGDAPPDAVRSSLQSYVSHLRKELGPQRLEGQAGGYRLEVASHELDALEFEHARAAAHEMLERDPATASELLAEAIGGWRGGAYADLADERSLHGEIARLEDARLLAIEDRIEADLALGRHASLVGELEALTDAHPLREDLWRLHMLALVRSGRPAEALTTFHDARAVLAEELGVDPGHDLQQLHERILARDPMLDGPVAMSSRGTAGVIGNPFKGLRAFTERDAADFFGRAALVDELVSEIEGGATFVAIVGPSGSGKSSAMHAGLIPTLRGREGAWTFATMRPGAHPFTELGAALYRAAGRDGPPVDHLGEHETDLLGAALALLPDDSNLVLAIDQFEELFTVVDEPTRDRFLANLVSAAGEPGGRCRVVVTLRADFYDRPLAYPEFGRLLTSTVVNVLPLSPGELESAATGPATRLGMSFEPGLLAELIGDVSNQPNGLPLYQYALTELFDRREGTSLTRAAYATIGGVRHAVASRAEETFQGLDTERKEAARQLFLRLIGVGRDTETRRIVSVDELGSLDIDASVMEGAVEAFVGNRLLTRDRDPNASSPTVEVAHEALLTEWERLRGWIDDGRDELRTHAALIAAVDEWIAADRDPEYLLSGRRLVRFEQWRSATSLRLTRDERDYLDAAVERRDAQVKQLAAAASEQDARRRRARRRAFALGAGIAALLASIVAIVTVTGDPPPPSIVSVSYANPDDNQVEELFDQGITRAERDFSIEIDRMDLLLDPVTVFGDLAASDVDLALLGLDATVEAVQNPELLDPGTQYVTFQGGADELPSNVTKTEFAYEQSGFLAGVAAASTTDTGVVGYLGGWEDEQAFGLQRFRAGFEAGVRWLDPDVEILEAIIADHMPSDSNPWDAPQVAYDVAAEDLYGRGADVVFHAAGRSGEGVFRAAARLSEGDRRLWAIGVDNDQWQTAAPDERPFILTSIVIRWDVAAYTVIEDFLDGRLDTEVYRFSVADGAIGYARSGDALSPDVVDDLDRAITQLAGGEIQAPTTPTGELIDPT